mmetsp:Transcript_25210/g.70280  ORF Transcript_25210/g.70280 Transcript_25210/m.70280 type:complete len:202 (+) Transcript_25210:1238-1843(+)
MFEVGHTNKAGPSSLARTWTPLAFSPCRGCACRMHIVSSCAWRRRTPFGARRRTSCCVRPSGARKTAASLTSSRRTWPPSRPGEAPLRTRSFIGSSSPCSGEASDQTRRASWSCGRRCLASWSRNWRSGRAWSPRCRSATSSTPAQTASLIFVLPCSMASQSTEARRVAQWCSCTTVAPAPRSGLRTRRSLLWLGPWRIWR